MKAIVPHAFGDHQECQEHKLNWCDHAKNPEEYRHKDLPNGKDLQGENLRTVLTDLFKVYASDLVVNKLVAMLLRKLTRAGTVLLVQKRPKSAFMVGAKVLTKGLRLVLHKQTWGNNIY